MPHCELRVDVVTATHLGRVRVRVAEVDPCAGLQALGELAVGIDTCGETLEIGEVVNTDILVVGKGRIVGILVVSAGSIDLIFLDGTDLGQLLIPVVRAVLEESVGEIHASGGIVRILACIDDSDTLVLEGLESGERTEVVVVGKLLHTILCAGGELCPAALTALGGNEDDTVCCAGTINGSSCSILQHGNALDVVRIEEGGR